MISNASLSLTLSSIISNAWCTLPGISHKEVSAAKITFKGHLWSLGMTLFDNTDLHLESFPRQATYWQKMAICLHHTCI